MDFLTNESQKFYKIVDGIVIKDYHGDILKIKKIEIGNAIIDSNFLEALKKNFSDLEIVDFYDCDILEEVNFNDLNASLNLYNCCIHNINSFNYCHQNIVLKQCKINKITNTIINSSILKISDIDDLILELIFMRCHFKKLDELVVGNENPLFINDCNYDKALKFIPYACPKLISLFIEGSVSSFEFLYHFNNLKRCEIISINDSIGIYKIYNPYINNNEERMEIIKNTKRQICNDLDIHLALKDKLEWIIKTLNKVNFIEEEKNFYLNHDPSILSYKIDGHSSKSIDYYYSYDSINDVLNLSYCDCNEESNIINNQFYIIKKQLKSKYIQYKEQLITSTPFMWSISGIPIIFKNDGYSHQDYINEAISMEDMFTFDDVDDSFIKVRVR